MPVGNSEAAFEKFKHEIGGRGDIEADGRVVMACGWDGTGKTALINRCAAWLRAELRAAGATPVVLELRNVTNLWSSVQERMMAVTTAVFDEVHARQLFQQNVLDLLDRRVDEPEHFYRILANALTPDLFLLVLLPPTEIPAEVSRYLSLALGRIVFFAETRLVDATRHVLPSLRTSRGTTPLMLDLGALENDEGWVFVKSRLRAESALRISEETVRRVTEARKVSIGELQALFLGTYADLLEKGGEPHEVTLLDLMRFYFRRVGR